MPSFQAPALWSDGSKGNGILLVIKPKTSKINWMNGASPRGRPVFTIIHHILHWLEKLSDAETVVVGILFNFSFVRVWKDLFFLLNVGFCSSLCDACLKICRLTFHRETTGVVNNYTCSVYVLASWWAQAHWHKCKVPSGFTHKWRSSTVVNRDYVWEGRTTR